MRNDKRDGNQQWASLEERNLFVPAISAASGWSASAAAHAAQERAKRCDRRLRELRSRRPVEPTDVQRARDHLAGARARLAAADARRRGRVMNAAESALARGGTSTSTRETPFHIVHRLQQYGITLSALFDSYFALGGVCGLIEVDAYVHGLVELPPGELEIVQHALWELTELAKD